MSEIVTFTPAQQQAWDEWVQSSPPCIQALARAFPPTKLYHLKTSNHRCTIYSYSEDGTLTINVTGEYNRVLFGRTVFGIQPDDLEECDLPSDGEDLGDTAQEAGYSEEDIKTILMPKLRERWRW